MEQILTPDFTLTTEIDLIKLHLERTLSNADFILSGAKKGSELFKEATESRRTAQEALESYQSNGSSPKIIVGSIPPRKLTSLRQRLGVLTRGNIKIENTTIEQLSTLSDIERDYLRWGIKGHAGLDIKYETEKEDCGPKAYNVATWDMVEIYEGMDLLNALYTEVLTYNMLSEEKKRQLSSKFGISPMISTVQSVNKTPASKK